MFAFYVTGASVRVWMGNEAPFCFSPSLLSQKSFIQGFPEPSGKARKRGERERKTRRSGSYFPDFFLKKEWRLEATSSFVHYGEKAPERDEEGEKRWRLGKKLQLFLSLPLSPRVYRRRRRYFPHFWPSPLPLSSSSSSSLHFFFPPSLKRRGCKSSLFLPPFPLLPSSEKSPDFSLPCPPHFTFPSTRQEIRPH